MSQTEINIALGALFVVGLVWQLKNMLPLLGGLMGKLKSVATVVSDNVIADVKVSSDSLPPEGFKEHVKVIRSASHAADPAVRESYYERGLTFAETLQEEYERVTKTKAEKNVEAK